MSSASIMMGTDDAMQAIVSVFPHDGIVASILVYSMNVFIIIFLLPQQEE